MKRKRDRREAGQEAPMVITPAMLVRLVGQIAESIRGLARKARRR